MRARLRLSSQPTNQPFPTIRLKLKSSSTLLLHCIYKKRDHSVSLLIVLFDLCPMAAVAPSPTPAPAPSPKAEVEQEMHVLAVDDSSVDRAVIAKILRSSKYRVTTVESATRALELLGLGLVPNVNMIITDYWMPGMTGYELLKRVKESSKLKEIPVVIMSSENVPNRISRCLEEGAEDFLLKPVRPSDVSRLCSRII